MGRIREGSVKDECSGREGIGGFVGRREKFGFDFECDGSYWRVLSRGTMNIFSFYRVILVIC